MRPEGASGNVKIFQSPCVPGVAVQVWQSVRNGLRGLGAEMAVSDRVYRRTEAGLKAWESRNPGVSVQCRRILGMIADETHPDSIRAVLREYSDTQIDTWLAQLESLRLLESAPAASGNDLDFTGDFKVSDFLGNSGDS